LLSAFLSQTDVREYKAHKRERKMQIAYGSSKKLIKEGIIKMRSSLKNWYKFWCQLRPGMLMIFKESHRTTWIGTIMLSGGTVNVRPTTKGGEAFKFESFHGQDIFAPKGPDNQIFFNVNILPKTYCIMRVPNEAARLSWMEAIEQAQEAEVLMTPRRPSVNLGSSPLNSPFGADEMWDHHGNDDTPFFGGDPAAEVVGSAAAPARAGAGAGGGSSVLLGGAGLENLTVAAVAAAGIIDETSYGKRKKEKDIGVLIPSTDLYCTVGTETLAVMWDKYFGKLQSMSKLTRPWEVPSELLEAESSLALLSEKFHHCYILNETAKLENPETRFLGVLKWFFSGFCRKPDGPKLPGMPVEGAVFRCSFDNPTATASPDYGRVMLVSEQVTHNTAALFVSDRQGGWMLKGSVTSDWVFQGDAILISNTSTLRLTLPGHHEDYIISLPSQALAGLLAGTFHGGHVGTASIACPANDYRATVTFSYPVCYSDADLMNKVDGVITKGQANIGTISGTYDDTVTATVGGTATTVLKNTGSFRKQRLQRLLVPKEQQHQLSPAGVCEKFFDIETASSKYNAAIKSGNTMEAMKVSQALFVAAEARRKTVVAPALFELEELNDVPEWNYKHPDGRQWDPDSDFYVSELNGVVLTISKADVYGPCCLCGWVWVRAGCFARGS
jgi:hypothetical protein